MQSVQIVLNYDRMQSVQIVLGYDRKQSVHTITFVLKELDQQVRKYNRFHTAKSLRR
jgi:hypothetical protein